MKNVRTQDEIKIQIEGLEKQKLKVPERSMFGDENWKQIDAQIAVLKGEKKPDYFYEDESAEEFEDGDNEIFFAADRAAQWLSGQETENLFDED